MPDNADPQISVIIPVYNDAARLALCLEALAAQAYDLGSVEVLVVDNGSDEPPEQLVARYDFCRLLHESQPGSYAARNRALREARGELLAFTDADCLPDPQWLANGAARLEAADGGAVVGGAIEVFAADQSRPTAAELYDTAFGLRQDRYVELAHYAATANMITSRRVMDDVGPFISNLKSSGDAEWGGRAHAAGWPIVYAEEVRIRHPARLTLAEVLRKSRRHAGGRIDYQRMRQDRPSWRRYAGTAAKLLLPHWRFIVQGQRRLADRGYGLGARTRLAVVTLLVQYVKVFEMVRTLFGGGSTRG